MALITPHELQIPPSCLLGRFSIDTFGGFTRPSQQLSNACSIFACIKMHRNSLPGAGTLRTTNKMQNLPSGTRIIRLYQRLLTFRALREGQLHRQWDR